MGVGLTEAQLAAAWAPACRGPWTQITLYGGGRVTVRPALTGAVLALNACLEQAGYETRRADTGAYVCRSKVNQPGVPSRHGEGIALDINWKSNPFGPVLHTDMPPEFRNAAKALRTGNGKPVWSWGGDWRGNKDAMHWQAACAPADLATGIDPATMPGGRPAPKPLDQAPTLLQAIFFAKQFRLGAPGVELNPQAIRFAQIGINNWFDRFAALTHQSPPEHIAITGVWDEPTTSHINLLQAILDKAEPGRGHNELGTTGPMFWEAVFPSR